MNAESPPSDPHAVRIHVWVPDYASSMGGIQTLSRFIVRALRDSFPRAQLRLIAKNDASLPEPALRVGAKFSTTGWWRPSLRTIAFVGELMSWAVKERPDFILTTHAHFAPVAFWLKKVLKIPYIALGNGIEVWEIRSASLRQALSHADLLLAISEFTQLRMAEALGISPANVQLFSCTFDSETFNPAPKPHFLLKRYGLEARQPVILTVARLASAERYKGYDQVLRALPQIRKVFPAVRYIIGGRGPDRPRVVKLIRELGVSDNVLLVGYIPDHELCAHYNLCDVFAMPSKGEGFGIVFLEAMGCGKPSLGGNKDGSVDPLLHGEAGVLIDPDNIPEIAEALIQVLSKTYPLPILYKPEELRQKALDAFGYDRFRERAREIVDGLIENPKSEIRNPKF